MQQGDIKCTTDDLLDWAFSKGEQHGRENRDFQTNLSQQRDETDAQKRRADLLERDLGNARRMQFKLVDALQAFVDRAAVLNDINTGPVEQAKAVIAEARS